MISKEEQKIIDAAAYNADKWIQSPDFDSEFEESMKEVDETVEHIKRVMRVDMKKI